MRSTRDVIIKTDRFDAARAFYRDVLGFELFQDDARMLGFETGSFRLFVEPGTPPGAVFDFEVSDLAAAKALLVEHGCSVEEDDASVPRLYLRDPFGLVFNIAEPD